jgi:hypothetical protein
LAETLVLYLSLATLPIWMIPLHGLCQRMFEVLKPDLGAQAGALGTTVLVDCGYAIVLIRGSSVFWPAGGIDVPAGFALVFLAANAMAFFYFQLVNVALTSIHMGVLLRIYWADGLPEEALMRQYDKSHMVGERLRRLTQLGQIEVRGETVHLRSRILILLSAPIYFWRRLLRMGLAA